LQAPPIEPAQVAMVRERLGGLPAPAADVTEEVRRLPPRPTLTLASERLLGWGEDGLRDLALLRFDYDGMLVTPDDARQSLRRAEGNRVVVLPRQAKVERAAERRLRVLGLEHVPALTSPSGSVAGKPFALLGGQAIDWWRMVHECLPALRAEGWSIIVEPAFRHRVVEAADDWEASLGAAGAWFALDLGIVVEGRRIPLLPVLAEALRQLGPDSRDLAALAPGGALYARLDDGRVIALPADRVRPMLETLVELFDARALSADGTLDVSLSQALALAEHEASLRLRWLGAERLADLARRLRDLGAVGEAEPPAGLQATLRSYQRRGLAWLQFVAGLGLGGILADDMGLGKTIQTLAHILTEKAAGRLTAPALVICPTSLVANWRHEAQRFTPDLNVLTLHGADRAKRFAAIAGADLVISTYALLTRDAETLLPEPWHLVVLDEAQAIKNPSSKAAQLTASLNANHRLCLTGTPIENHLGELWSQLSFLVPGLLGDQRRFGRVFRTPIEKQGDTTRRDLLTRRIRPFLLRRTKGEVEADLPAKTEILRRVELTGEQRDLYETVRLAMHERVRQAVAAKGFARSRIVILDALLKLRQVCCDPRLVKLAAARRIAASAKLAHLLEMLPDLIEDGRRVLLFSQFTSMLDLIRPEIERAGLAYVELRGDTADRATPVASFQAGRVPLFLISLKAGGVGLNLTAADTVILYDPWWNPAVEAQAMDRAHRIGQDKPVFVYKLIAEGTIEERMLELQERKRALAAGVLSQAGGALAAFGEDDLQALFQPLG
ncbi:MAG: DEAD/DEAH box helicase, partial [Geminicoccaceae bacterium]